MLDALRLGHRTERRAARFLRGRGLRILARNLRVGVDEIDILARDGDVLVIVEVRYRRAGVVAADLSVTREKLWRLRRAEARLRRQHRVHSSVVTHIDLVLLGPSGQITWTRGVGN